MKMEKLLGPQSMRAEHLFLHLIGSRLHGTGVYRGPEEVLQDILSSAARYTQIKGIYEAYCEEGLRNLSPASKENFHQSGKFERLQKVFEKGRRDAAWEFYGAFQDHSRRYNSDTEVFPSHLTHPELREQFEKTWHVQFRAEGRQFEKYVRIHHFPGTVLREADLKLCEVGRNMVMLEMLEKVSFEVDWQGKYELRRPHFRKKLGDACREVWDEGRYVASPADFANYVWENYEVEAYDIDSAKDKKRFKNGARQNYRNWKEIGLRQNKK